MIYGILVIGVLLVIVSFIMNTENFLSSVLFKCVPFFSGSYLIFYFLMNVGWIIIKS